MAKYGYVDVGELADYANNLTVGVTANDIMRFPRADVQPVNQWINADDRLPENNKLVLCYVRSTTGEGSCYMLGALSCNEFWFLKNDGQHLSFPNLQLEVTHWQPLPEPPKNGGAE